MKEVIQKGVHAAQFHVYEILEKSNKLTKIRSVIAWDGNGQEEVGKGKRNELQRGRGNVGGNEISIILTLLMVMISGVCTYVKMYAVICFKCLWLMVHPLYFNTAVKN